MSRTKTPSPAVTRFRQLSDERGVGAVAAALGVHISTISHLRAGDRHPGLRLANRIEEMTRGWIKPSDWTAP